MSSVTRGSCVIAAAICLSLAAPSASAQTRADSLALDSLRAALQKYQDPYAAVFDGYFSSVACVDIARPGAPGHVPYQPGGMGIHFLNMSVVGPVPDPAHPSVLIYEPDGAKLRLVAAEWFIPLATGVKGRPQLLHMAFDGPMEGHMPLMPMELHHWDLHVWLFKHNPRGMFNATNPNVKCGGYSYRLVEEAPKLVPVPQP